MKRIIEVSFALAAIVAVPAIAAVPAIVMAQTSIQELQRKNSITISGRIVRIFDEDFILDDGTGQILVEAEERPLRSANFRVGERVTVNGTYDDDNSINAISITRQDGKVVQIFDD